MKVSYLRAEHIEQRIYLIRGHRVMLDKDLAELYGVMTGNLNKAMKRNRARFPSDFMFQLTRQEFQNLISHFGISSWGGTRKLPYAFTQEGVAMLSGVLHSSRAIQVNIAIMRAFVKLREMALTHKDLARRIDGLERRYDARFRVVFKAIRRLMEHTTQAPRKRIGFR